MGFSTFRLPAEGAASPQCGVAAVSRIPNSMELWWPAPNGAIEAAYWYDGGTWQRYQLAAPGSASPQGGVAALSRIPNSMELWWPAPNGAIEAAYWYDGGTWQRYQLMPPGSASPQGGVAAVSRIPNSMELWWPAPNGAIEDAYWYDGGTWQHYELAPPGSAAPEGGVAAVSRIPNSLELWWPTADKGIEDAYWYDGAVEPMTVSVRYRGLVCFGETDSDQLSNSDEPYAIITTIAPTGGTTTVRSQVYQDVDGGEGRPDEVEVYRGPAYGLTLGVVLMENDEGDPEKYRSLVESGVHTTAGAIASAVTAVGGPLAGAAVAAVLEKFVPDIADAINDLLDTGDDQLGAETTVLDSGRLVGLAGAGWQSDHGVSFKIESKLFSADGASYKVYFDVVPA